MKIEQSERKELNAKIAEARREYCPRAATVSALRDLELCRDLQAFMGLEHSIFGPTPEAWPSIALAPLHPREPETEQFHSVGMLASSARVHKRRLALLTSMSATPMSVTELVNALGERYAVHCTRSAIAMAAQDLAYLKAVNRVEKIGGFRNAKWIRIR